MKRNPIILVLPVILLILTGCQNSIKQIDEKLYTAAKDETWAGSIIYTVDSDTLYNTNSFYIYPDGLKTHTDHTIAYASLTKLLTATLVLHYVDKGEIILDAPLSMYRPAMRNSFADFITVRQLLAHRSGLPREFNQVSETSFVTYEENDLAGPWLDTVSVEWRENSEDEKSYSNLGYWYLGSILESVSGKSIHYLFKTFYGDKMGLESITFNPNNAPVGHNMDGSLIKNSLNIKGRYTSGGVVGNASDFSRFTKKLLDGKILKEMSFDYLFTDFGFEPDKTTPYLQAAHIPGFSHLLVLDRKRNINLLLTNIKTIEPLDAVLKLGTTLYETIAKAPLMEKKSSKEVFTHIKHWEEVDHPLSDAIFELATAIGTSKRDSIEAVIFKHYDLEEFGPKEREQDLDLLPKLPEAMGGWSIRAFRVAEMDGIQWIFLHMRTDDTISDEDSDVQFTLGMASQPENPEKVHHVFYNFDGFKMK